MFSSLRRILRTDGPTPAPKRRETSLVLEALEDRALPSCCRFTWCPPKSCAPPKSSKVGSPSFSSIFKQAAGVVGKLKGVQQVTININYITIIEVTNITQNGKHDSAAVSNTATTGAQSN